MSTFSPTRYDDLPGGWFRRCGKSGLDLPAVSLGMWHNFGDAGTDAQKLGEQDLHENATAMMRTAFDRGVTHFDFANNYGPAPGAAEARCGRILESDFGHHREEIVVSSKAGYRMQPGPYGDGGGRKYLIQSCEASLRRLRLDHLDLFYHHRNDPSVPLEETLGALDHLVRSGKTLHAAVSNYPGERVEEALSICERDGLVKPILHQVPHHLLDPSLSGGGLDAAADGGMGNIVFSPLAQGLLTDKYLDGVPADSRAAAASGFLKADRVTPELQAHLKRLNAYAGDRGQTLAQLALCWVLGDPRITSALIGASRPSQVTGCCDALQQGPLSEAERAEVVALAADAA
ncbi:aldo/keto reductase [Phycisphaera mikurensis]|uniref:Putative aldo/keto reductase n=1 Tax=Phycisphaera mikurensis (strain NBRC 102666 / KCTC 22515 / FYK2301M01) TaxID=1142394 RepID=I0IIP1_PHYMF|nr:aldo/keto reductase [Phycisphaera mikurensis]MBB6442719.1 L-glyceraldehyde 3-phosphate reductase [Phycisphaera mikurensis]BAM05129.1 putative aldo/keto reductase [Phycisphaera mikurensis NBRC 102666]